MTTVRDAIEHWPHVAPLFRAPTTDAEYDDLVARLDDVLTAGGHDEAHPLASLASHIGDLIEAYDERHHPIPDARGVEVLRYLMTEHGLAQGDLPEVGTQSVVSELLSGRRALNLRQVAALAERFHLPADVFIDREDDTRDGPRRSRSLRSPRVVERLDKEHRKRAATKVAGKRGRARRRRPTASSRLKSA